MTKGQPLKLEHFADFIAAYGERDTPRPSDRQESDRFRRFTRKQLEARDDNLDIFWLKDESLEDSAGLADPDVIAAEIVEDLRAALDAFALIAGDLGADVEDEAIPAD